MGPGGSGKLWGFRLLWAKKDFTDRTNPIPRDRKMKEPNMLKIREQRAVKIKQTDWEGCSQSR